MFLGKAVVGLILLAWPGYADIPVHCKSAQVEGTWHIELTPPATERSSCHHGKPDLAYDQPALNVMEDVLNIPREIKLSLAAKPLDRGGLALVQGKSGEYGAKGNWTMVADEGFEVEFPHDVLGLSNGTAGRLNMFAFNRYDLKMPNISKVYNNGDKPIASAMMKDLEKRSTSKCDETLLGWYSIGRERWGCWKGKRKDKASSGTVLISTASFSVTEKKLTLAQMERRAQQINSQGRKWRARAYPRWVGKTPSDLARIRGQRWLLHSAPRKDVFLARTAQVARHLAPAANASSHALVNASSNNGKGLQPSASLLSDDDKWYLAGLAAAEAELPAIVDWTNATGGLNFLEPVMDQEHCGSCWAVAGMRMITARHKIAQRNPDALPWSISFPLYCSEYNQGCDGGYGFLIAKWSEDVGLVPATCARYDSHGTKCNVDQACVKALNNGTRWRASNYRYLGVGNRARTTTAAMLMRELHERGPIVVGLSGGDIGDDFMLYAGGIYEGEEIPPKDKSGGHAVTLVGYGEEDGEKYWTIQNSWGPDWGEDGYVRISRDKIKFRTGEVADVVPDEQHGRQVDMLVASIGRINV